MAVGTTALPDRPKPMPAPLRPGRKVPPLKPLKSAIAGIKRRRSK